MARKRKKSNLSDQFGLGKPRPAATRGRPRKESTKRQPNGQPSRSKQNTERMTDADHLKNQSTVLEARLRHIGADPKDEANMKYAKEPMLCSALGKMLWVNIARNGKGDVQDARLMWSAACHMQSVITAFDKAIGAPNRHAGIAQLETGPSEPSELDAAPMPQPTDEGERAKLEEERYRRAVANKQELEGWLSHTDNHAMSEAKRVCWDAVEHITDWEGLRLALSCVRDGLAGNLKDYRGRK